MRGGGGDLETMIMFMMRGYRCGSLCGNAYFAKRSKKILKEKKEYLMMTRRRASKNSSSAFRAVV